MATKFILLTLSLLAGVGLVLWALKYDDNDDLNGWG